MSIQVVSTELAVKEEQAPRAVSMIEVISRAALDPTLDVEKMVKLVELHERIQAREAKIEYSNAMARLAMQMPRVTRSGVVAYEDKNVKGKMNEAFRFARYEDIDRAIRPLLSAEGFSLSFKTEQRDGGGVIVTGTLNHIGGHSESASIPVALDTSGGKNNIQAMGSSFSYGKRYTATMLLNIVTEGEDNDARTIPPEFIDQRQVDQIYDLLTACNMTTPESRKRFYAYAKVERAEDIRADQYQGIVQMLEKKAKEQK